jgi:hypothetical protein
VSVEFGAAAFTAITGPSGSDRIVFLADGRIVDEIADPTAQEDLERMKLLER